MPELIIRHRDGRQRVVPLGTRPITIGRAESCEVVLRLDGEVSREHAQVWVDEDGYVLVADLNSKNGTRVDGGELFRGETRVVHQRLRIGEHEILVRGAPPPASNAPGDVTFVPDRPDLAATTRFFPSSKGLDLNQQRLGLLMGLADRIGGAFERKQLLEQALDACCEALGFERGLIVLKTPRGTPELPVARNIERDETGAYQVSRTLINRALVHGERAIVNNPATDLAGNISDSLVRYPICSALCVPILHRNEILGVIYGDRITQAATYTAQDVDFLAAIAQQVGVGLANLRLLENYIRLQKVEAELSAARRIQRDLLPSAPLERGRVLLDGCNEPSAAVGGDYFDYGPIDDHRIGFVIADVTGHGLAPALLMANFQAALHVALDSGAPLPELAARLNRLVCNNTASHVFITGILGVVDADTGLIEFVNAGHPDPILVGADPPPDGMLGRHALPFGIDPDETYAVQQILPEAHRGVVLFFTDGLVEATDPQGRLLGTEPVLEALAALPEPGCESVLRAALDVVRKHLAGRRNLDDMTLLAVEVRR